MQVIERVHDSLRRYFIDATPNVRVTEKWLHDKLRWNELSADSQERNLSALKSEYDNATTNMNVQFAKLAMPVTALSLILVGLSFAHGLYRFAIIPFGLAIIVFLWAQSPQFKVFSELKKSDDIGVILR